jgi:mono/diheme cytochrome c family protein
MKKAIRSCALLAAVVFLGCAAQFAQSPGAATYKAKCQSCHGAAGLADTSSGKAIKVKPVTDPTVKKLTEAEMVAATRNGMGKMQPYKDKLSDAEIKGAVAYFRTFLK